MKRMWHRFIIAFFLIGCSQIPANASVKQDPTIQALLKGRVLIIDMDINDEFGRQTFLKGKDLLLVKITPLPAKHKHDPLQFQVVAFSKLEELMAIDLNHDGIIAKDEMAKANVALLRYNHSGDIVIDPLGISHIKQLNYVKHKDGTVDITLVSRDDKKFKGYFINL